MINHNRLLLPLIVASLVLACGLNTNPLSNLLSSAETASTPTASPVEPATKAENFPLGLTSASSGLDQLNSYRANLVLEFAGLRNEESTAGQIVALTEVTRRPPARRQYLHTNTAIPRAEISAGASEFFRLADKVYVKKAVADDWLILTGGQAGPDTLGFFEFERLITLPAAVSSPPQLETVNGLSARHYVFNENDLTDPNIIFEQAQGDLWVATEGNYLLKYTISASLRVVIPDPRAYLFDQGQFSLHYALTDLNADFTISPPIEAATGSKTLDHLPRLPDAEIISVFPTLIEYTSAISAISATIFYRAELSALDWTEDKAAIFNEKSHLTFSQENQTLTVIITPAEDSDKIKVVLDINKQ